MKINILLLLSLLFIFSGCGTKRQYFEPEKIQGDISFSGYIPSSIKDAGVAGASMHNGQIISIYGVENYKILESNDVFFGKFDDRFLTSNQNGTITVKSSDNSLLYTKDISSMIASASLEGETLALVTTDNVLFLINMHDDKILYTQKMDDISAIDSRIASPYFLGSLVIFPTLDGKLTIVDRYSGLLIRNVVISAERHFNNVIFLDVAGDRMIGATSKRVISINPSGVNYIEDDIKNAILLEDRVFVFTKDGRILLTDLDLKVIKEKKFPFAIFSGAIATDTLNVIEKMGYLIKSNLNLEDIEVFYFPTKINQPLFVDKNRAYYDNRYIEF